jgi:hypothetical protein
MAPTNTNNPAGSQTSFVNAANQSITVNGIPFACRDLGPTTGVPLVLFKPTASRTHNLWFMRMPATAAFSSTTLTLWTRH